LVSSPIYPAGGAGATRAAGGGGEFFSAAQPASEPTHRAITIVRFFISVLLTRLARFASPVRPTNRLKLFGAGSSLPSCCLLDEGPMPVRGRARRRIHACVLHPAASSSALSALPAAASSARPCAAAAITVARATARTRAKRLPPADIRSARAELLRRRVERLLDLVPGVGCRRALTPESPRA
jgi:hypothetical protein